MPRRLLAALPTLVLPLSAQAPDPVVQRIQKQALASEAGYQKLAWLCDRIGHRISGSPQLEEAVRWAQETLRKEGFEHVRGEKVMVPRWVRGREAAEILAPTPHRLHVLGLGGTEPTRPGGLKGDVVVVGGFDELKALPPERVKGRIVCFDVPFTGYGATVPYRVNGALEAAKLGAIAVLVRSVGPVSLDTPHTGTVRYEAGSPRIPAASLSIEGATQLRRMQDRGERIAVRLELENQTFADAESANVVAEIPGREKPEEIVLLGGHLDSWDVGQGAQDDGAGSMIVWEAARLLKELGLRPRRTLRVVLFTNEENGLRGGLAYRDAHKDELAKHVVMLESDGGNGLVQSFSLDLGGGLGRGRAAAHTPEQAPKGLALLQSFAPHFASLGAPKMELGGSGADVGPSVQLGVPGIGVGHDDARYWDIHHTWADTFDKVKKEDLQRNIAYVATLAYLLAESEGTLR